MKDRIYFSDKMWQAIDNGKRLSPRLTGPTSREHPMGDRFSRKWTAHRLRRMKYWNKLAYKYRRIVHPPIDMKELQKWVAFYKLPS